MSSFPSRMAKRALKERKYARDWKVKDDKLVPTVVVDRNGKPVADTWVQAAVRAEKAPKSAVTRERKPKVKAYPKNRDERIIANHLRKVELKARVSMEGRKLPKKYRAFKGHKHGQPTHPAVTANLSLNHPDWGMSPAKHARTKAGRAG